MRALRYLLAFICAGTAVGTGVEWVLVLLSPKLSTPSPYFPWLGLAPLLALPVLASPLTPGGPCKSHAGDQTPFCPLCGTNLASPGNPFRLAGVMGAYIAAGLLMTLAVLCLGALVLLQLAPDPPYEAGIASAVILSVVGAIVLVRSARRSSR